MSWDIDTTIGIGSLAATAAASYAAVLSFRLSRRSDAREAAREERDQEIRDKAATTQEIASAVLAQLQPSNGKTVAQVAENSNDAVHRLEATLNAHVANSAVHLKPKKGRARARA